jgi:hypothetical protein
MIKNYRIVEEQNISGDVVFIPQERKLLFFWMPFMELSVFPKRIEFETYGSAKKFIKRQIDKPKEKVHYVNE